MGQIQANDLWKGVPGGVRAVQDKRSIQGHFKPDAETFVSLDLGAEGAEGALKWARPRGRGFFDPSMPQIRTHLSQILTESTRIRDI